MRASGSSSRTCRGLPKAASSSSLRIGCRRCGAATASSPSSAAVWLRTAPMRTWSGQAAAMRRCTVCRQASMKSASAALEAAQSSGAGGRLQDRPQDRPQVPFVAARGIVGRIAKRSRAALAGLSKPSTRREELAFLPAALEIVETPPPPIAGAISGTVMALFCVALVWACFGKVDIVATASGRIIPSDRTKVVQPLETGVVRAIHVRDGQSVKAGEVLIELDPTVAEAELRHLQSDLMEARLEAARLRAALARRQDPLLDFNPPEGASSEAIELQRRLLMSQVAEQKAKIEEIKQQESQKEAERATIRATINKLNETIPVVEERVRLRRYLYDRELGSKL